MKSVVLEKIHYEVKIKREDLISHYDKADYMIPQQPKSIIDEEKQVLALFQATLIIMKMEIKMKN